MSTNVDITPGRNRFFHGTRFGCGATNLADLSRRYTWQKSPSQSAILSLRSEQQKRAEIACRDLNSTLAQTLSTEYQLSDRERGLPDVPAGHSGKVIDF